MKKFLLVGSMPPPYHGQSIAFESATKSLDKENCRILEVSFRGGILKGGYRFFRYFLTLPFILLIYRPSTVYFLCSRTLIGGLRDIYLLSLLYFTDTKIVNHLHGSDFNLYIKELPNFLRKIVVKLYGRVDKHIVLVEGMKRQFEGICDEKKVEVIPNFYSDSEQELVEKDFEDEELRVVYLSSVMKSKGVFELIEACKQLAKSENKVKLYIAGDFLGDEHMSKEEVKENLEKELENINFIEFVGYVNKTQKFKLLSECHVFALPSYYRSEAVPLSIIEAMSMGCCIVVTDYRYLPDIVKTDINGKVVDVKSSSSLFSALEYFAKNRNILSEISKNNALEARNNYSEQRYRENVRQQLLSGEYK